MKRLQSKLLVLSVVLSVIAGLSWLARAADDSKAEIRAIEQKAVDAMTADQLTAFYDSNDIISYDYIPPLQYVGAKAVHDDVDKFFHGITELKADFLDIQIETDGQMGVAHSLQHIVWKGADGKQLEATFRVTNCYHRVNGEWKIFHMHTSFPIDPKTKLAQMNLKR